MSKLIDKLNQVVKAVPQPMGFRTAKPVPTKPKMLLIASLARANNIASADAVLITKFSSDSRILQKIAQTFPDIPWGLRLENIDRGRIGPIVEAGCDFVVFPAASTISVMPEDDEIGKILQVEASLSEGLLKAVNELPIDAVLIANEQGEEYFLTWHRLMLFQHFADLLTKPLLVPIPLNVTANELQVLWETGVGGVVVEAGVGQPVGRLEELRQVIDKLPLPSPRKRGKAEALLPHIGEETSLVIETDEEEEEE